MGFIGEFFLGPKLVIDSFMYILKDLWPDVGMGEILGEEDTHVPFFQWLPENEAWKKMPNPV